MTWVVAIPSYNRAKEIVKKSLNCLKEGGVPASRIYVFVVKEQLEEYRSIVPKELYNKMIVGVKGLVNQRQFINDYFNKGQDIVCMDDDIRDIKKLKTYNAKDTTANRIESVDDIGAFFSMAFKVMKENGANIWGIVGYANAMYMKDTVTTDLKYIIGALYGIHNTKDPQLRLKYGDNQEDKERTALYFDRDGTVVRFNNYAPVTTYYAPGGMESPDREKDTKKYTELLVEKYPQYFKQVYKKSRGIYDLKFLKGPTTKAKTGGASVEDTGINELPIRNEEQYEKAKEALLEELHNTIIPKLRGTKTSPGRANVIGSIGRTITFGYGMRTYKGYGEFVSNKKHPELFELLVDFGNTVVPKGWSYETITLNEGVKAKKHKDGKNNGDSVIIGIGDFTGGDIKVWDAEDKNGKAYNLHDQPLMFNGATHYHQTMPFKGERYTMIFYRQKRHGTIKGISMIVRGEIIEDEDDEIAGGIFA